MSSPSYSNITKFSFGTSVTFGSDKSKGSNGYHDLPHKVLIKIFSNCTEDQLLHSVIPVCQNWKYAAMDPCLWKTLTVKGKTLNPTEICQRIRRFKELEQVSLKGVPKSVVVLRQVIMCSKRLRKVALRYCEGIRERSLRHLVQACPNLEAIDLKGTEFKGIKFYQELPILSKLRSINFSSNSMLRKENILTTGLNCRNLEEFLMSVNKSQSVITEPEWCFIISTLSPALKSICIDAATLGDSTFYTIIQCPHIQNIGFCNAYNLTGDVFVRLTQFPIKLKGLRIRYAHLVDGVHFQQVLTDRVASKLEVLDLTGCWKITDQTIQAISTCLELKRLNLKNCKLITTIEPIVTHNDKLREINIAFCSSLAVSCSLLMLADLELLFINEDCKFNGLLQEIVDQGRLIRVMVCASEFNKSCQDMKKNKSPIFHTGKVKHKN